MTMNIFTNIAKTNNKPILSTQVRSKIWHESIEQFQIIKKNALKQIYILWTRFWDVVWLLCSTSPMDFGYKVSIAGPLER